MHVIGTAGHVDHGKSTLVERLTGIDPDRFEEEKRRGLTIDLGFAWLQLPSGREIGIVDVPGHERFIKNMLAGAGGVNVCIFVVAANEGWMPQSSEHLAILDILGVRAGVVALTKIDTVDHEILELAQLEIEEKLAGSSLAGAAIVPVSAATGEGIDEFVKVLDDVVRTAPAAADHARPRLWVDRVFTIAGAGTVVTGTLTGGSLSVGDEIEISPEGRRARVRTIQSHKKEVHHIGPGNRVALNLAGLERQGAERGDAIVAVGRWRPTTRLDALVRVLPPEVTGREHELSERGAHLFYVGSAETPVRLKLLDADRLVSGRSGYVQLYLRDPLPLAREDRFVLRDAGRILTFGGGVVLDPLPPQARRGDVERLQLLETLEHASPDDALVALVERSGLMPRSDALLRSGASGIGEKVVALDDLLSSRERVETLREEIGRTLARHHRDRPLERGMPREQLRVVTALEPAAFDALLNRLPEIVQEGVSVRMADHAVRLAPEQQGARQRLMEQLEAAAFQPPPARELKVDAALVRALVEGGELVRIGDFYLTATQAARARADVRRAIEERGPLTVAEIRDLLGTSRKYAVPLLEWLDSTGATRRQGDLRSLGPHP